MTTISLASANSLLEWVKKSAKVKIVLCSFLIALAAQISLPLPFSPVPMTLQTLAIMCVGLMLGSKNGALSVIAYLAQSIVGLPVLAGGMMNPLALIGPRGGYLIGFIVLAFVAGWCFENRKKLGKIGLIAGLTAASALQLGLGTVWLGIFIGLDNAFAFGFVPFVSGEMLKIMVVMAITARNVSTQQA